MCLSWLVTGRTLGGLALYPDENRLERDEALRLWTTGSAWFSSDEGRKGALVPGQLADVAVLSQDFFSVPEPAIASTESLLTLLSGEVVHASGPFAALAPPPCLRARVVRPSRVLGDLNPFEARSDAMISVRKSNDRGHARHGWLESFHTFSFAGYHDPEHMGFGDLRVINDDVVQPKRGFAPHSHEDMEIVTYVLEGALEHKDSLGSGSVIRPGDVQRMSAGTGVTHSEFNPSASELVHLMQIWILPEREGLPPSYEQKHFPAEERRGRLRLVASRDARDGSLRVHQDVSLYATLLGVGESVVHALAPGRRAWLQVTRGELELNGAKLAAGDGAAVTDERTLRLSATKDAELLLFDLA